MANTRRRTDPAPSVAGAPSGTSNWVDTPSTEVSGPASPRIGSGEEWNIGNPYNSNNNSGFAGGSSASSNITTNPNGNPYIAPPNQNIGPWASGYGTQPVNVNIPNQPLNGQPAYTGSGASSNTSGMPSQWTEQTLIDYARSRGVNWTAQNAAYWLSKKAELDARGAQIGNPNYANERLFLADDWTPNNQRYMAGQGGNEFTDPWGSTLEGLISRFLGNSPERASHLAETYRARAKELMQPAYTSQDEAAIQARAYDQLERRRQETLKNGRERIYARGFAPTSGTVQGSDNNINTQFEQARTGISSDILRAQLDETNRRKDAATQLEALATEALNGGDLAAIQATGLPLQLMNTRQNNALATYSASNGGNIASLLSMLLNSASGQQTTTNNQNANNAAGYGNLLSVILNSLFPRN